MLDQTATGSVNWPAAPALFTSRPHRSCRPYRSAIILPLGKDPSAAWFATAHSHAWRRTSCLAAGLVRVGSGDRVSADFSRCFGGLAGLHVPDAVRRTWRISNSYDPIRANDGHAAITRPVMVGSATATLAARLAMLPITSNAHGNTPPRLPDLESASNVVDAATIIPSTDNGVSAATQPGWPCSATSKCM